MTSPASPAASATSRAFLGDAMHTPTSGQLEYLPGALIEAESDGKILAVHRHGALGATAATARHRAAGTLLTLEPGQYLLPGFVDLHTHHDHEADAFKRPVRRRRPVRSF